MKAKKFIPPTLEDVKQYIAENPELSNLDAYSVWKGYDDGGWIDTQGKPVRNWKLKLWTRSRMQDFYENGKKHPLKNKTKLWPIQGRICSECIMPAVYKDGRSGYDWYYCGEHMPEKVKAEFE